MCKMTFVFANFIVKDLILFKRYCSDRSLVLTVTLKNRKSSQL